VVSQSFERVKSRWYSRKKFRYFHKTKHDYKLIGEPDLNSEAFMRVVEAITAAPITEGNRVKLLVNGDQIFPAMLEAIRSATKTINLLIELDMAQSKEFVLRRWQQRDWWQRLQEKFANLFKSQL
jgi:phosphatidylserine/phosphatidylglycerophosphate/cardiolipin synthase-like enzyme